jgi:hypothetical protein
MTVSIDDNVGHSLGFKPRDEPWGEALRPVTKDQAVGKTPVPKIAAIENNATASRADAS